MAHVASKGKGSGAEYSVRYDATGEQQSELLLPGSYRLVTTVVQPAEDVKEREPAAAPAAASEAVAPPRSEAGRAKRAAPDNDDAEGEAATDSKRARPDATEPGPAAAAAARASAAPAPAAGAALAADEPPTSGNGDDDDDEEWLTTGSEWLGKRVVRLFDGGRFIGVVISWVKENDEGDPPVSSPHLIPT